MSAIPAGRHQDPGRYEIRVKGHLDSHWAAWFNGLTLAHGSDGTTVIRGPVADQAALHGLLQKIRDLGIPLISVNHVEPGRGGQIATYSKVSLTRSEMTWRVIAHNPA